MSSELFKATKFTIGLSFILFGYTIFGAIMYMKLERHNVHLESEDENHEHHENEELEKPEFDIEKARDTFLQSLNQNKNSINWLSDAKKKMQAFEDEVQAAESANSEDPWDFIGSMIFSITVYTSIGYGHIAPATTYGKIFTMVYAFIGIPLCLIVLTELGKLITKSIKGFYSKIRPEADVDEEFNFSLIVSTIICLIYLFGGAVMYSVWEDWSYLEAVYFVFISTSTIGFGDYLPSNHSLFLLTIVYIFIGLSLVSMVINVVTERLSEIINILSEKFNEVTNAMSSDLDAIVEPKKEL